MPPKRKNLRLESICRACLAEGTTFKPIFKSQVSEMMMACASIKVEENDGLPKQVCNTCYTQISHFFKFKKKLECSDASLRLRLKEMKMANIIAQAANDADIELTSDMTMYMVKDSDDDEPLAIRQARMTAKKSKRLSRQSKIKANKLINSVIECDIDEYNNLILEVPTKNSKQNNLVENIEFAEVHNLPTALFTNEPPPLVALVPLNNATVNVLTGYMDPPEAPASDAPILEPICDDAPPLVPIKPPNNLDQVHESKQIPLECSICLEDFLDVIELKNHLSTQHSSTAGSNLICNICRKEFLDKKRLIGHLKGHIIVKPYTCKICKKKYPNPSTFKVHMRTHTGERPYKCEICGKGFIRWAGVVGHMKSHTNVTPFKCDICQKGFKVNSNLERHKILHTGEMPFCCSYCGKTFTQSDNLQLHVRSYHTHERPYLCSECGKGFVSATRLNRHMWVHTGYKPYSCKTCHKSYINSVDLKKHERSHNGGLQDYDKPYPCNQCNLRFLHQCRLTKHMKTHEKPYACLDCPKTFSKQNDLTKHVIIKHTDEQILVYKSNENF